MGKTIQFPNNSPDVQTMMVDGKPESVLSTRGVLLLYLSAWKNDQNQIAHTGLRRYCEYLAMHDYGQGAEKILNELDEMDYPAARAWVKRTFAKYAKDQLALAQYFIQV